MSRSCLILLGALMLSGCDVDLIAPGTTPVQRSAAEQAYRKQLAKDVLRISKCNSVDAEYSNPSAAPVSARNNLPRNVIELWTLAGCQQGIRKRVEIMSINDHASNYTIRLY